MRAKQPPLGTTWTLPWAGKKCRGLQKENDWPCFLPPHGCGCPSNRAERRECFICGRLRSDNGGKSLGSTKAAPPSGGGSGRGGKHQVTAHADGESFVSNGGSDLVTFLAEKAKAFSSNPPPAKMQAFAPKLTPGASVLASMFNLTPMDGVVETASTDGPSVMEGTLGDGSNGIESPSTNADVTMTDSPGKGADLNDFLQLCAALALAAANWSEVAATLNARGGAPAKEKAEDAAKDSRSVNARSPLQEQGSAKLNLARLEKERADLITVSAKKQCEALEKKREGEAELQAVVDAAINALAEFSREQTEVAEEWRRVTAARIADLDKKIAAANEAVALSSATVSAVGEAAKLPTTIDAKAGTDAKPAGESMADGDDDDDDDDEAAVIPPEVMTYISPSSVTVETSEAPRYQQAASVLLHWIQQANPLAFPLRFQDLALQPAEVHALVGEVVWSEFYSDAGTQPQDNAVLPQRMAGVLIGALSAWQSAQAAKSSQHTSGGSADVLVLAAGRQSSIKSTAKAASRRRVIGKATVKRP